MARYAEIKKNDIANGTGVRVSIFLSGCTHHCKNCFNSELWDFNYGEEVTLDTINEIIESAKPDYISGITLLGGDPLCGDINREISELICHTFKEVLPSKTIWLYTGYLYEDIKDLPVMKYVDVLVDGLFVEELKNLMLKFRGSENQRIIDVQQSRKEDKVILFDL